MRIGIESVLRAIRKGVEAVAKKQNKPDLIDGFVVPHGNDELLKKSALLFAKNAVAVEEEFIALGFREDFIEDLKDRVKNFGEANEDKSEGMQGQVGSGKGLDKAIEDGLLVLLHLNVLMRNLYKNDPVKLGEWNTALHIVRVGTSGKKKLVLPPPVL